LISSKINTAPADVASSRADVIHPIDGKRSITGSITIAARRAPTSLTAAVNAATSSYGTRRVSRCVSAGTPAASSEHQSSQPK
jgi:hypothetical protein